MIMNDNDYCWYPCSLERRAGVATAMVRDGVPTSPLADGGAEPPTSDADALVTA